MQTQNPYAAPGETPTNEIPTRSGATAVFIGAAIGAGISFMTMVLIGWAAMWIMTFDGVPTEKLYATMGHSLVFLGIQHAADVVCMLVGGYWSACLSEEKHLTHAFLTGLIAVVCVLFQLTYPYDLPIPDWSKTLSLVTPIPCALLGAWRQRRGK